MKQAERAVLIVNGREYKDWETILVRHALFEHPPYRFRFTCSEGMPAARNLAAMQIKPGDICTVLLAGHLAITGQVSMRQVYVDGYRHAVEIQGSTATEKMAEAGVVHKTGEFKNADFMQIARAVTQRLGINVKVEGGQVPTIKFPRVSVAPGQSVFDLLDSLSRTVGVTFTSNPQGDFVVVAGPGSGSDTVYEGDLGRPSYIEGREVIFNAGMGTGYDAYTQAPGTDQRHGAKVAHEKNETFFEAEGNALGEQKNKPSVILSEHPAWSKQHLEGRANADRDWLTQDMVTVIVVVNGWLKPSGGLWERNGKVGVVSPMLMMTGQPLTVKSATFTQDNASGTRTSLELVNANALSGWNESIQYVPRSSRSSPSEGSAAP